ncbi:hypothetical protein QQF64_009370 [Cirrhinus molitorella]|uniref:Uncharacterized protein n=1 Tax=Cirrhinus molitorella TaxID=172907 RepID=A0ABR3M111_9TELE
MQVDLPGGCADGCRWDGPAHRSLSEPYGCWPHLLGSDNAAALPLAAARANLSISPATTTFLTAIQTIFHVHLVSSQMQIFAPPPPRALERRWPRPNKKWRLAPVQTLWCVGQTGVVRCQRRLKVELALVSLSVLPESTALRVLFSFPNELAASELAAHLEIVI